MEGTWEDGGWSEKGEGVSLTELIFDSLNIPQAVCQTCRENFQHPQCTCARFLHFYIKTLHGTLGNLEEHPRRQRLA